MLKLTERTHVEVAHSVYTGFPNDVVASLLEIIHDSPDSLPRLLALIGQYCELGDFECLRGHCRPAEADPLSPICSQQSRFHRSNYQQIKTLLLPLDYWDWEINRARGRAY